jgi:serine/threonine-protein kinase
MDRWRQIEALFDQALSQPSSDRDAYLRRACAQDLELYREVTTLLSHDADGTNGESWAARAAEALLEERSRTPQSSSSRASLAPGMSLGPYEVTGVAGAGAMGEVYHARDSHLHRDVALKVLPDVFARDPDRLARLKREAQVLASLNHQHIAAIYGFEDRDGIHALVLEFVEGATLAQRIARGPIPLDEALRIAKQIAEALETAHEHGIVHRDLKPANIKVKPDGAVKLLDFGLAKAIDPTPTRNDCAPSQQVTSHELTEKGVILGTWAYMSPEQARGVRVDSRTDVWAFGCVFYEMLTGHRAFDGPTSSDVLAAVLEHEPDFDALPAGTPDGISRLLRRALTKDVRDRLHAIGDARLEVVETLASLAGTPGSGTRNASRVTSSAKAFHAAHSTSSAAWRRVAVAVGVLGIAIASAIFWMRGRQPPVAPPVSRFELQLPEPAPLLLGGSNIGLGISRDGTRMVYPTNQALAVRLRNNDVSVIKTGFSAHPFFSLDGQWIGYIGDGLRKVAVTGGPSIQLAPAGPGATATWGEEVLILADAKGLFRVPLAGGLPEPVPGGTFPNPEQAAFPEVLPGGSTVLFTAIPTRGNTPELVATTPGARIEALDLRTGSRKVVVRGGGRPRYLPTGHLLYGVGDSIMAVAFDADRLETRGDPVHVAALGGTSFAVSNEGTLIYVANTPSLRRMVWVDRRGREEDLGAPPDLYNYLRLSPDGSRVAIDLRAGNREISIWNIERKLLDRFTLDPTDDVVPEWSRDGKGLVWASSRGDGGVPNLFIQAADRGGSPERLIESPHLQHPSGFAPDGRLLFAQAVPGGGDIMALSLDTRRVEPVIVTEATEGDANVSPHGRWLAYSSNESGSSEVYVSPYPNTNDGKTKVSASGGKHPLWSRNGRELYYRDIGGALLAVPVPPGPRFLPGKPMTILPASSTYLGDGAALSARHYDVSLDGTRFLMVKRVGGTSARSLVVEQNWTEELKRLASGK